MSRPPLRYAFLGRMGYGETVALQERLRARILEGESEAETLLLTEHAPVVTLGRSAREEHLLVGVEGLARRGVAVARSSRGGAATYHGPGQLVGYPVMRLPGGVARFVEGLLGGVAETVAALGVSASYRRERPGLWCAIGGGVEAKLCAVGLNVQRRVVTHGFALNVSVDLAPFGWIVPCGAPEAQATSIEVLRGGAPGLAELAAPLARAVARGLGREAVEVTPSGWEAPCAG